MTNRKRVWWTVAAVLAVAGPGLVWVSAADRGGKQAGAAQAAAVPSARAVAGRLERTIRLTGTTDPERFASMLAPRMRGSRSGPGAGGAMGVAVTRVTSAKVTSSSSSSSSESTSSSSSSSSSSNQLATALNRFSTPTSSAQSSSSSSSASSTSSTSTASASTTSGGSGGGGGGGGRFELVLEHAVAPGARVKKGDVIAEFDRLNMLTRLDDYRAELDQQAANLVSLKANLEVEKKAQQQSIEAAKGTLEKARYDLKTIPVQSEIAAEQLKLAEAEAAARYKQLLAEVRFQEISQQADWKISSLQHDQNEIEFKRSQANADRMLFRAPIDGIVVMGDTFRGGEMAQIRPGDQVRPGMMFMRVVDLASMVVNATVNQTDMDLLRVGARARVRFDAYPDLELPGRVHAIAAMSRSGGFRPDYVREIPVVIKLERLDPRVVPDLSVSVDVVLESEPGGVRVPREAIFTGPAGGGHYVYVRGAAGWERRSVELGLTNNVAAIVRTGVRPQETVALGRPPMEQAAARR